MTDTKEGLASPKENKLDEISIDSQTLKALPGSASVARYVFRETTRTQSPHRIELPLGTGRAAVALVADETPAQSDSEIFRVLSIELESPIPLLASQQPLLEEAQRWAESGSSPSELPVNVMSFHGAHLCWTRRRIALLAEPHKLKSLTQTVLEFTYYESELQRVERTLGESWPAMENDLPLAFEFQYRNLSDKRKLAQRFHQVMLTAARLARVGPYANSPHHHPPTLASQVAERLRERSRMAHRHEALTDQLEVFQGTYELCGQRANDFTLTRSGNALEWTIIVMLFAQIVLTIFDMLTSAGS